MPESAIDRTGTRVEPIQLQPSTAEPSHSTAFIRQFPPDLIDDAARRLRLVSLLMLIIGLVSVTLSRVLSSDLTVSFGFAATLFAFIAINVGVYLIARQRWLDPERLFDLGSAYQVVVAIFIAARASTVSWSAASLGSSLPVLAVWIVLFPIVVPNTLGKTLVAGLLCAVADPVATGISVSMGLIGRPDAPAMLLRGVQLAAAVVVSLMISRVVRGMGQKLEQARHVGSYRLERVIGRGGMGEVWKATHRILQRPTAVKLIHEDIVRDESSETSAEMIERFSREARATAALRSPNTVELYDFGVARSGRLYYVMEWLDGLDLHSLVETYGPQPAERVVWIVRQTCHSLNEAHLAGLVHRDVKPQNIFLCRYGADVDFVKVLDFGLVKALARDGQSTMQLTRTGTVTGTPLFLAPEQVTQRTSVDRRADIYSLGCVAYYLLSGEYVFRAISSMAVAVAHANEEPAPLSEVARQDIPAELEAVIMQCLAKAPDDRPQTVRQLSTMLDGLDGLPSWTPERRREWWDTYRPVKRDAPAPG